MQIPTTALRRKLAFWMSHGVMKESSADVFTIVENLPKSSLPSDHVVIVDDDSESAMASEQQVREEEMQVRHV